MPRGPHLEKYSFKAGNKGGPGRPKGFRGLVREVMKQTNDCKSVVTFVRGVMEDKTQPIDARLHAAAFLISYGVGKPTEVPALAELLKEDEKASKDVSWVRSLSDEQLLELRDAGEKFRDLRNAALGIPPPPMLAQDEYVREDDDMEHDDVIDVDGGE